MANHKWVGVSSGSDNSLCFFLKRKAEALGMTNEEYYKHMGGEDGDLEVKEVTTTPEFLASVWMQVHAHMSPNVKSSISHKDLLIELKKECDEA